MNKNEDNKIKFSIDIIIPESRKANLLPPHIRKNKITGHYAIIVNKKYYVYFIGVCTIDIL